MTQAPQDMSAVLQARARTFRRLRIVVLALVVGYFFLPYGVKLWIPVWLPFLAAVWLEGQFFVGGYLHSQRGRSAATPDRGPQPRDIEELGGEHWRETMAVYYGGEQHFVPTEGLTDEEIPDRVADYLEDPDAFAGRPRPRARGHPVGWYLLEIVAVLAVLGAILFVASRPRGWDAVSGPHRLRAEARFSREATLVAGHPVRVTCDTTGDHVGAVQEADGLAVVGGGQAWLTPSICNTLYQLAFKHRVQSFPGTARAIAVLGHESSHLRGVTDEGLANCYGFQVGVRIGVDLGLSESRARSMMREQLATNAADSEGHPQYVVPKGCSDGGRYDLNPAVSAFP